MAKKGKDLLRREYFDYMKAYKNTAHKHQMNSPMFSFSEYKDQKREREPLYEGDDMPLYKRFVSDQRVTSSNDRERINFVAFQQKAKRLIRDSATRTLTAEERNMVDLYQNSAKDFTTFRKHFGNYVSTFELIFENRDAFSDYLIQYSDDGKLINNYQSIEGV